MCLSAAWSEVGTGVGPLGFQCRHLCMPEWPAVAASATALGCIVSDDIGGGCMSGVSRGIEHHGSFSSRMKQR